MTLSCIDRNESVIPDVQVSNFRIPLAIFSHRGMLGSPEQFYGCPNPG